MATRMTGKPSISDKQRIDMLEGHIKPIMWQHKSWSMRTGLPEVMPIPVDHNGKPTPTFATLREAMDWFRGEIS